MEKKESRRKDMKKSKKKRYYYVYMDPNMPMNGENIYVVNHIFPSELNGNTGYKFYYNPGNGDIYNNWRYAFY